jgi:hypothetical protein
MFEWLTHLNYQRIEFFMAESETTIDPQMEWHKANTPEKKSETIKKFPKLRHIFSQALDTFNHLSDDEKKAALESESKK